VHLVEDHGINGLERWIGVEESSEHAVGHHLGACGVADPRLAAHAETDTLAGAFAEKRGEAGCRRARASRRGSMTSTGLDATASRSAADERGLPGSGLGDDHRGTAVGARPVSSSGKTSATGRSITTAAWRRCRSRGRRAADQRPVDADELQIAPTCSSMRSAASLGSHLATVVVITSAISWR
jgi:hypothetical protein